MPLLQIDGHPIAEIDQLTCDRLLHAASAGIGVAFQPGQHRPAASTGRKVSILAPLIALMLHFPCLLGD